MKEIEDKKITIWKDIKGYEGLYQVSEHGEVKSMPGKARNKWAERILRPGTSNGYRQACLSKDGNNWVVCIHSLVAMTFIGIKEKGMTVNHIDGNKLNNHYSNLEYCTNVENLKHAHRLGLISYRPKTKPIFIRKPHLTLYQVQEIKARKLNGEKLKSIAADFNVNISTVCRIFSTEYKRL